MDRRDSTYKSAARSAGSPAGSGNLDGSTANQKLHAMCDTKSCTDQPGQPLSVAHTDSSMYGHRSNRICRSSSIALSTELIRSSFQIHTVCINIQTVCMMCKRGYLGHRGTAAHHTRCPF